MEGCQICRLLWCALLLLGGPYRMQASNESPAKAAEGAATGNPTSAVDELKEVESSSVDNTTSAKPFNESTPTPTAKRPKTDPALDLVVPSGSPGSGAWLWRLDWKAEVLVGGAVVLTALLVSTVTLAVRVCQLNRQVQGGRPSRTNVDLVSGMGYPSTSRGGAKMGTREEANSGLKMEEVQPTEEGREGGEVGVETERAGRGNSGNGETSREGSAPATTASQSVDSSSGPLTEVVGVLVEV